ncbi:uncharacterized protein LOC123951869 [Meles meles]|uniref:uncharacterized protein LOC123951869 n=1 Tax=Meles meles TaxID=9662 RepID=UPI001E69A364|nr:uncharacterized protein LOC123951869 [Meles meles]
MGEGHLPLASCGCVWTGRNKAFVCSQKPGLWVIPHWISPRVPVLGARGIVRHIQDVSAVKSGNSGSHVRLPHAGAGEPACAGPTRKVWPSQRCHEIWSVRFTWCCGAHGPDVATCVGAGGHRCLSGREGGPVAQFSWPSLLGGSQDSGRHSVLPGGGQDILLVFPHPPTSLSQTHGDKEASWVCWVVLADAFCRRPPISKGLWGPTSPTRTETLAQACKQRVVWLCFLVLALASRSSGTLWPFILGALLLPTQQPCPTQAYPDTANPRVMKCPSLRVPGAPNPPGNSDSTWSLLVKRDRRPWGSSAHDPGDHTHTSRGNKKPGEDRTRRPHGAGPGVPLQ